MPYSYEKSRKIKSKKSFINFQDFFLIGARGITRLLYYTPVTPHQVIFISMVLGVLATYLIIQENRTNVYLGAICLFYKNVLDKVDGSLARARGVESRRGRFYDSLSDFIVSFSVFSAIAIKLSQYHNSYLIFVICYLAFVSSMFQCSFFIYYQVAFIKFSGGKTINRLLETVTYEDKESQDGFTLLLQRIFLLIYGWQDLLVARIDGYFRAKLIEKAKVNLKSSDPVEDFVKVWYMDRNFLSLASLLSIGSHMVFIAISAVAGKFEYYLFINLIIWNLILVTSVFYHYYSAKKSLKL